LHQRNNLDNPSEHAALLTQFARLELKEGRLDLAATLARQALSEARRADHYFTLRGALMVSVDVLEKRGELSEALGLLREYSERTERYMDDQQKSRLAQVEAQLGYERQVMNGQARPIGSG